MTTLEFDVWDASTGDYQETVSIDGYFDHSKNCYVPEPKDWNELTMAFFGKNVIITAKKDNIVIEGLDADGTLKLTADDGAQDYPNNLLDNFISNDSTEEKK